MYVPGTFRPVVGVGPVQTCNAGRSGNIMLGTRERVYELFKRAMRRWKRRNYTKGIAASFCNFCQRLKFYGYDLGLNYNFNRTYDQPRILLLRYAIQFKSFATSSQKCTIFFKYRAPLHLTSFIAF